MIRGIKILITVLPFRGRPHITSSLLRGGGGHKMMMVDDVREGGLSK